MATLTDTSKSLLPKIQAPPEWGIEPVPHSQRSLGFVDYLVLWGDLGIGLLVLLAGTFLVPGLSLRDALIAVGIGSVLGALLLAIVGLIGSDNATPTMVLLRPVLGLRGSYVPTALNVLQLVGWTIFEFIVMGYAANELSQVLFGFSSFPLWAAVFGVIVILMGIGGPIGVVRQWLEKFAVWIALATGAWLTFHLLTTYDFGALLNKPGDGSLPFWVAVDLAIALPISWLPLVADYNRFSRNTSQAFWGTLVGFAITNFWFLSLGAMALLGAGIVQEPKGFAAAIALTAGWIALLILLADETHNAWADLYSSAVSLQNAFPKIKQRWLIIGLGILCYLIAILIDITQYQNFLYLIGSFFIPLFGILVADYFIVRRRNYRVSDFYRAAGTYSYAGAIKLWGLVAWLAGVAVYHITNPATLASFLPGWDKLVPSFLTSFGGSLPSFVAAFVIYGVLGLLLLRKSNE